MLAFRLSSSGEGAYIFPHIVDMRTEIHEMNRFHRDQPALNSLITDLKSIVAADGPAELLRLAEVESLIKVRQVYANASSWSVVEADTESASRKQFRVTKKKDPKIGEVNRTASGVQAYGTTQYKAVSSQKDNRYSRFLVSRQEFYIRELAVGLAWIEARRDFINSFGSKFRSV